jgi:ornithine cyclodeaminase/alanine dehydrogenase-like protein (mu-crystallin family)
MYETDHLLYLTHRDVEHICQQIDSIGILHEMFLLRSTGQTILPDEAYLSWQNELGESVRSLNMPGYVGGTINCVGTKIINGNIDNYKRGYPRASGLTLLHDPITARTFCIMEGAHISSLRTASVSLLASQKLKGPELECVGVIGAGVLAQAHIALLIKERQQHYPHLQRITLFDLSAERSAALHDTYATPLQEAEIELQIVSSPEQAIRPAQLIIAATTTTEGYIPLAWLQSGAILVNVSLDDPLPEVVLRADCVIVDDWMLVKNDPRRLLGRMYRAGQVVGPDEKVTTQDQPCRRIDAELTAIVVGTTTGRRSMQDIILVNPFGMAIEDIALATRVYQRARELNLGLWLDR